MSQARHSVRCQSPVFEPLESRILLDASFITSTTHVEQTITWAGWVGVNGLLHTNYDVDYKVSLDMDVSPYVTASETGAHVSVSIGVEIDKNKVGIRGSFTRIRKTATPDLSKGPVKMIEGDLAYICDEVEAVLKKNYLL